MKRSFLKSLNGLSPERAEEAVEGAGYEALTVDSGTILPAIARLNTVILFVKDGKVEAFAGDPCQLED